jgi:hypothetical protein
MMLGKRDTGQIREKGISIEAIEKQINNFINGFPWAKLARPATVGDGIFSFHSEEVAFYEQFFNEHIAGQRPVKFVPASGAASRMFKQLFGFIDKCADDRSVIYFLTHLNEIAFFKELNQSLIKMHRKGVDQLLAEKENALIIKGILSEKGLNYANLPKGLLLFHNYPEGARTAAEEHLVEAAHYACDSGGISRIHFTISPEHQSKFLVLFEKVRTVYEERHGVKFDISFSVQKPSTDTIAVDEENMPFRNPDGTLHFRPGGHGALISNLNDLDGDIIFIKNIDNIVPDRLKPETYLYKKVLGGYLLQMKEKIHGFLEKAMKGGAPETDIAEMSRFMEERLFLSLPEGFHQYPAAEKQALLTTMLNRPMRVCGMVRNEGEPGGGPFWVKGRDGQVSLQIIESSQIDLKNPLQKAVMEATTHFNPVDLVCCIKDFMGKTFDLGEFVDPATGFISVKSSGGKVLKAQELPGLWNGAMARWITVFVEVPVSTFNPVKTVNDLLRSEHLT